MSDIPTEKHVRRFNSRLRRAVKEHDKKLDNGDVSLPSRIGKLVIVVSNRVFKYSQYTAEVQRDAFHEEADAIADLREGYYGGVEIRRSAIGLDIVQDLEDREVSDMIMIGHGAIDCFWLDSGGSLRWRAVAQHARYLKQGRIEQRMCGHFNSFDAVPMGTFALQDQQKLVATVGETIDDVVPDESLFRSVYHKSQNSADDINALIKQYELQYKDPA